MKHLTEMKPGEAIASDEEMVAYARQAGNTIYHPVGTCAMGAGPDSVLDSELRVRGVERLRVVDASVMPRLVSGNTNAPTIMIAERASDLIRAARRYARPGRAIRIAMAPSGHDFNDVLVREKAA